jgi:hypothetical protein
MEEGSLGNTLSSASVTGNITFSTLLFPDGISSILFKDFIFWWFSIVCDQIHNQNNNFNGPAYQNVPHPSCKMNILTYLAWYNLLANNPPNGNYDSIITQFDANIVLGQPFDIGENPAPIRGPHYWKYPPCLADNCVEQ